MLLTLREIQKGLDDQFLPLKDTLTGFRLVELHRPSWELDRCELQLGVRFPKMFRNLVETYDFGHLTIGPTAFCQSGDYLKCLVEMNQTEAFPWWGSGPRPATTIMVADAEFQAVLLETADGSVLAFAHGKPWGTTRVRIATDFALFVKGIGTVFLVRAVAKNRGELAKNVAVATGGVEGLAFWNALAE